MSQRKRGLRELLGVGKPTPPRKPRKGGKSGSRKSAPVRGGVRR